VPINSMTGFARASAQYGNYNWTWEVRSVNSKGLDVRLRIPSGFDVLDLPARKAISQRFKRGSVALSLNISHSQDQTGYRINQDLLNQLIDVMKMVEAKVPGVNAPSVDGLMGLRGVIETVDDSESEAEREAAFGKMMISLEEALDDLLTNRISEGGRMESVLHGHIDEIEHLCTKAEACAGAQPDVLRKRLVRQLKDVMEDLPDLDQERIAQEAAILMTKADVREELDRLRAHIEGARDLLVKGSPCGRKLDFLCQEFNREANTLCSKAQDVDLTRIGLDFKATIDQFREQVQNIE